MILLLLGAVLVCLGLDRNVPSKWTKSTWHFSMSGEWIKFSKFRVECKVQCVDFPKIRVKCECNFSKWLKSVKVDQKITLFLE